jgi:hypothetical protein
MIARFSYNSYVTVSKRIFYENFNNFMIINYDIHTTQRGKIKTLIKYQIPCIDILYKNRPYRLGMIYPKDSNIYEQMRHVYTKMK